MSRVAVIACALVLASCQRDTPGEEVRQRQDAVTQTSTERAEPSGPLLVEWTDNDLENGAHRIGYGSKPAALLQRNGAGALVFSPETEKDHIAVPFTLLQPYDGERSLELILDVQSPGGQTCAANLQDQAFNVLTMVPCSAAGEQRQVVTLPREVTSVRIYFQSSARESVQLPRRIRLIEHR